MIRALGHHQPTQYQVKSGLSTRTSKGWILGSKRLICRRSLSRRTFTETEGLKWSLGGRGPQKEGRHKRGRIGTIPMQGVESAYPVSKLRRERCDAHSFQYLDR